VISILYPKKLNVKNYMCENIFGGLHVLMPNTSIQIPNNQLAQVLKECCFNKKIITFAK
jgi:hypothetical protein